MEERFDKALERFEAAIMRLEESCDKLDLYIDRLEELAFMQEVGYEEVLALFD